MPRILEVKQAWTITGVSSGGGKAVRVSPEASAFSAYFTSSSGCTATMQMQTATGNSSVGLTWSGLGTSTSLSTGQTIVHQFNGPLDWVRPYCASLKASTDVVSVLLIGN